MDHSYHLSSQANKSAYSRLQSHLLRSSFGLPAGTSSLALHLEIGIRPIEVCADEAALKLLLQAHRQDAPLLLSYSKATTTKCFAKSGQGWPGRAQDLLVNIHLDATLAIDWKVSRPLTNIQHEQHNFEDRVSQPPVLRHSRYILQTELFAATTPFLYTDGGYHHGRAGGGYLLLIGGCILFKGAIGPTVAFSSTSAELQALHGALLHLHRAHRALLPRLGGALAWACDSKSAMNIVSSSRPTRYNLVATILDLLQKLGIRRLLHYKVPAHVGVRHNEVADQLATSALRTTAPAAFQAQTWPAIKRLLHERLYEQMHNEQLLLDTPLQTSKLVLESKRPFSRRYGTLDWPHSLHRSSLRLLQLRLQRSPCLAEIFVLQGKSPPLCACSSPRTWVHLMACNHHIIRRARQSFNLTLRVTSQEQFAIDARSLLYQHPRHCILFLAHLDFRRGIHKSASSDATVHSGGQSALPAGS